MVATSSAALARARPVLENGKHDSGCARGQLVDQCSLIFANAAQWRRPCSGALHAALERRLSRGRQDIERRPVGERLIVRLEPLLLAPLPTTRVTCAGGGLEKLKNQRPPGSGRGA